MTYLKNSIALIYIERPANIALSLCAYKWIENAMRGVWIGCDLSLDLFNFYIEFIVREQKKENS